MSGFMGNPSMADLQGMTYEQLLALSQQDGSGLRRVAADVAYGPGQEQQRDTFRFKTGNDQYRAINSYDANGNPVIGEQYTPESNTSKFAKFGALAGGMALASGLGAAGAAGGGMTPAAGGTGLSATAGGTGLSATGAGAGLAAPAGASLGGGAASAGAGLLSGLGSNAGAIAAGLGAIAGGSQKSPENLTSTSSIPEEVKPFLNDYMGQAQAASQQGPNGMQQSGYNAIQNVAGDQSTLQQGQNTLNGFMDGSNSNPYMGNNPQLQNMIDQTSNDITKNYMRGTAAQTDGAFANANAFGGSAWQQATGANQEALAKQLADTSNQYRFQNYQTSQGLAENQLGRQMSSAMFSPQMDAARYTAGNQMMNAGNNQAQWKQQNLQNYGQAVGVGMGSGQTNTQTNPNQINRAASALGGALGGYQLSRMFG